MKDAHQPDDEGKPVEPLTGSIWIGATIGIIPAALSTAFSQSDRRELYGVTFLFFALSITLWPLLAIGLACIRTKRRFGLGMLLGVGVGFLLMATLCVSRIH